LIITTIENHCFVLGVDEWARIRCRWKESQFQHATTEMFVEKLGRVDLTIDAFVELQNNVLSFKTSGLVALLAEDFGRMLV